MKRHLSLAGILALVGACSQERTSPSCRSEWGTGLNAVGCKYRASVSDTCDAAVAAVTSFNLTVDRDQHDVMGGEVVGRRADGCRVTVKVDAIDQNNSKVFVRVEPCDRHLARRVREKIADRLGMGKLKSALFAGDSEEAADEADLETGSADSNPARFGIMHVDDRARRTRITFIAGNATTDAGRTITTRMRGEFDRQIAADAR